MRFDSIQNGPQLTGRSSIHPPPPLAPYHCCIGPKVAFSVWCDDGVAGRPRQIVRNKVLSGAVKVMLIMLVYMCCTRMVCIWQVL